MYPPYATAGDGQVYLQWDPSNDVYVDRYLITTYYSYGYYVSSTETYSTDITIYGLSNGTSYYFTVIPLNQQGQTIDDESAPSNTVTPTGQNTGGNAPVATAGNGLVYLSWDSYEDATYYQIRTYQDGYGFISSENVYYNTETTIYGLTNSVSYYFTAQPRNGEGDSLNDESAPSNTVTPTAPVTIPDAPTIKSTEPENGQVVVGWFLPASDGGSAITSYTVSSSPGNFQATVYNSTATSATVTGLTNGTSYSFTVVATNAVGNSPSSGSLSATPRTIPNAPTGVSATAGNAQANVSWTAPGNNGGSAITSYTVTSSPGGLTATTANGTTTNATVSGLTNGTVYTFTVVATNVAGPSAASTASNSVTPNIIPNAPTSVIATAGNTTASLSWTAPTSNGGSAITSYTVSSSPGNFQATTANGSTTTATVIGLTNGTSYTFTVVATTVAGPSAASTASTAIIPRTIPGAPTSVSAATGNAQAVVNWIAPGSNGGSAITSYTVSSSPGNFQATTANGSTTTATVIGLTNGTSYTFTVVATNVAGPSAASTASTVITPSANALNYISRVVGGNSTWEGICWSAEQNKFVAIASGGTNRVMTSPNGITWTEVSGAPANGWRCVIWSKEAALFVAVANSGTNRVMTSPNGTTWTERPVPHPTNQLFGVCWSPELSIFVAVAEWSTDNSNRVMTSPNGITWTARATPANNQWASVCWSPERALFVAVAYTFGAVNNNRVMTSPDGTTWTLRTPASTNGWIQVCWSAALGLFAAVADSGDNNRVMTSPDGITWTGRLATSAEFRGICWSQEVGLFIAAAWSGTYRIWSSSNGITWSPGIPSEVNPWYGTCWSKELHMFAVASRGGSANKVMTALGPLIAPGAPTAVSATAGNGNATVSWTAPGSNGGSAITSYTVISSPGGLTATTANGTTTNATVPGLTNGTAYTFTVVATNVAGSSSASTASNSITPITIPNAPTIGTAISGNAQATVNWTVPNNGGSAITGYKVTSNYGVITNVNGATTATTIISGLTNGKTYTFTVIATNAIGDSIASSSSNTVLPISPNSITTGSNFIGKTLVIGSTGTSWTNYARVIEFNNNSTNTYLGVMFASANEENPWFSFRPLGQVWTEPIMPWTTNINVYYIYVFSFISDIQVKYNIYEYNGTSTIISKGTIGTYTAASAFLQNLNQFWLGRTIWNNDMYNGIYSKIGLYNGDLLALTQATVLSTLLQLVQSTQSNVYYNSTTNYAFRPAINNFIGIVVNILNYNTGAGSTVTTSNITLIGSSNTSGGYLNITGSFIELPSAPTIGTATAGNGNATVTWTASTNNGGTDITGYTVTSSPGGVTATVNGTTTIATVSGLTNQAYTFTVIATNSIGNSPASAVSNSITPTTDVIPNPPTSVIATAGNTTASLSWTAPASNGGTAITSYTVSSSPSGGTATINVAARTASVTGLTNGTAYTFTVVATNAAGTSSPSNASNSVTPNIKPNAPTSVIATAGNGNATVSWTAPGSNGGSAITSYTVSSSPGGLTATTANGTTTNATVPGLTNGTAYTFTVVATNAAGTSETSNASNSVTPRTIPNAPTDVLVSSGPNIGQITVSWTAPSNGGSVITSYDIVNNAYSILESVNGSTTSIIISNLNVELSYSFFVVAINVAGPSNPSISSKSLNPLTFSFNEDNNFVGGKLYIIHNYDTADISFNWYSSINNSFTNPILLTNTNNRNYLFIRLEYQKLYIRCIVNYNSNTYTSTSILIPEKYNPELFDYNINLYTIGQKQSLFNTAMFMMQDVNTPPVFNIDLSLNQISTFLSLNRSLTTTSNLSVNTNGFETSWKPFGERLLEIVALKIFGHPKARAAIGNDNDFYDTDALSIKVYDAFNNIKNEFGNYYMGIYDITQVNNNVQLMNVSNFNIIFPFYLNGTTSKTKTRLFQNGPNVGGSLLVNGQYNIPLLLTFN